MTQNNYSRRDFLNTLLAGISMGALYISCQKRSPEGIPTRPLGHTGEHITIIGLGGWDIAYNGGRTDNDKINNMKDAIDRGLTFFDNCWDYHDGLSEELMGRALAEGGRRKKCFLMTKVCGRDYKTAKKHLEDSLTRLKTDVIDLWQFHGIKWDDDPELIFDPEDGAMKAALEAKKEGKIRYIGFTGHQDPKYHLAMLDKDFEWDAVQMPLNIIDPHYHSFQKQVMTECNKRDIGVLAMKGLAAQGGRLLNEFNVTPEICRRYVLSLPVTSMVCGIQTKKDLLSNIEIARSFKPLKEKEIKEVLNMTEEKGSDGQIEEYKVGNYGCDWYHNKILNG